MKLKKQLKNLYHLQRQILGRGLYNFDLANSPDLIDRARRLQAKIYLHYGNVDRHQINKDGHLDSKTDPYVKQSVYFVARRSGSNEVVAATRLILQDPDYNSLQIAKKLSKENHLSKKLNLQPETKVAEISGLVKKVGQPSILALLLMRECHNYALKNGIDYLLFELTDKVYQAYGDKYDDVLINLGEPYRIPHGNNTVQPLAIDVRNFRKLLRESQTNKGFLAKMFNKILL